MTEGTRNHSAPGASPIREAGPVLRTTLASQVVSNLIDQIGQDGLRPGDTLPSEGRLAELFGVSRPVVREALRHLVALRMIEIVNGKVPVVLPVTSELLTIYFEWAVRHEIESISELHEMRRGVEPLSASLAADRATPDERAELSRIVEHMRDQLSSPESYGEWDAQLHLAIAEYSHNSLLWHLGSAIRRPLSLAIQVGITSLAEDEGSFERMQSDHEAIVSSIVRGDGDAAAVLMESHIRLSGARILEVARSAHPLGSS